MKIQVFTDVRHMQERIQEIVQDAIIVHDLDTLDPMEPVICNREMLTSIVKAYPLAKAMVISDSPSFEEGKELLSLGAKAYANTYIHEEHLRQALQMIASGNIWLYPEFMQHLITQIEPKKPTNKALELLTERENEISLLISKGATNKEIASELSIAERTVKNHLSHIFEKLQITDRLSLALLVNS